MKLCDFSIVPKANGVGLRDKERRPRARETQTGGIMWKTEEKWGDRFRFENKKIGHISSFNSCFRYLKDAINKKLFILFITTPDIFIVQANL